MCRLLTSLRRRWRADEGFTLIELVITTAIVGVIVAGLVGVVLRYLQDTVDTQARITESTDVQFVAAYWQRDVASVGRRSATYNTTTNDFPLLQSVDVAPTCALPSGTTVVTLLWSDYSSAVSTDTPSTISISYVAQASGGTYSLRRVRCTDSSVDSNIEVAHSLSAVPTKSCFTSAGPSNCALDGDQVPTVIELSLTVQASEKHTSVTPYHASLRGERRQS